MKVDELYLHFGSWQNASRELKLTVTGIAYWRKRGAIPYRAQLYVEKMTTGKLKAAVSDDIERKYGNKYAKDTGSC